MTFIGKNKVEQNCIWLEEWLQNGHLLDIIMYMDMYYIHIQVLYTCSIYMYTYKYYIHILYTCTIIIHIQVLYTCIIYIYKYYVHVLYTYTYTNIIYRYYIHVYKYLYLFGTGYRNTYHSAWINYNSYELTTSQMN